MKKILLLSLTLLLCFTLDADAFHWRLFHHQHHHATPGVPVFPALPSLPLGGLLGGAPLPAAPPASIQVSQDVVDNIKAAEKNLADASSSLKPLFEKYKIGTGTNSGTSSSTKPNLNALQDLSKSQRDELMNILKSGRK